MQYMQWDLRFPEWSPRSDESESEQKENKWNIDIADKKKNQKWLNIIKLEI